MIAVTGADLFCGAGGTSTGFLKAMKRLGCKTALVAVNHWATAIDTHSLNHPTVTHKNADLERVDPRELVPSGKLDMLWASPECTYYSVALGGKPVNNQSRATPKWVLKWLSVLDIKVFCMENVPEFRNWGPLHRTCNCSAKAKTYTEAKRLLAEEKHEKRCHFQKPIKSRLGEYFHRFIRKLQALGYRIDYRVLRAADYGAPTTRKRLFLIGEKDGKGLPWPEPTHTKPTDGQIEMFTVGKRLWKTADKHVIDWNIPGESIFFSEKYKNKPLSPKTMRRIIAGFYKFNGKAFMMGNQSGALPQAVDEKPVPTLTAHGEIRLFQPWLISQEQTGGNGSKLRPTSSPVWTVTGNPGMAVAQPYIIPYYNEREGQGSRAHPIDKPFPTVVTENRHGLAEPYLIQLVGTSDAAVHNSHRSVREPVPTVRGNGHFGVAQPYIVEYYGTGGAHSTEETVPTVTGNDRFGLAMPVVYDQEGNKYLVDIHYRMFTPKEYARAQGFPDKYRFKGGRKAVLKQIGNAVPPAFAEAITYSLMKERIR